MADLSAGGRRRIRGGATRPYRGSRKRLRRIGWLEHTPPDFWILIVLTIALLAALAWSMRDPSRHRRSFDAADSPSTVGARSAAARDVSR